MPPGFENYVGPKPSSVLNVVDAVVPWEGENGSSSENDLVEGIARIKINNGSYNASDHIPSKYLNALGFVNYSHLGDVPWGREDVHNINFGPEFTQVTQVLAIDCEMVGVSVLQDSELGRVSIINEYGFCIYDTFAKPEVEVTCYRSTKSGIYAKDLENAPTVSEVVKKVKRLVYGKTLIGHSIHNDLDVLKLKQHPDIRDTAIFFKNKLERTGSPSLKELTEKLLKIEIQTGTGGHSSIQDAQATLKLYLIHRAEWEQELAKQIQQANLPVSIRSPPKPIQNMHIIPRQEELAVSNSKIFLRPNLIAGAYSNSAEYKDVHFRLLLEDFLRPLRDRVKIIRNKGRQKVNISTLFTNVRIQLCSKRENEVKKSGYLLFPMVENNLVDVDWDESKLFMNGSLLLISPDNFKSVKFAIIKWGPKNSTMNRSTDLKLHVEFCKDGPTWVIDETTNNFMVLESEAFYEAYKHTLNYFQVMELDKFPMKKYIVDAVTTPCLPKIMATQGTIQKLDFQIFVGDNHPKRFADPLNLNSWPTCTALKFDPSQYVAFRQALTQELTVIQGPPGTGKTFIGVQTINFLLTNPWLLQSCPILVVSYTNHALDQTLEKVFKFITETICKGNVSKSEHLILRIGGGSKSDVIQPLALKHKKEMCQDKQTLRLRIEKQAELLNQLFDQGELINLNPGLVDFQKLPKQLVIQMAGAGEAWKVWNSIGNAIKGNPIRWFGLDDIGLQSLSNLRKQAIASAAKRKGWKGKKDVPYFFFFEAPKLYEKIFEKHPQYFSLTNNLQMDKLINSNLTLSTNLIGVTEAEYSVRWAFYFFLLRHLNVITKKLRDEHSANLVKYNLMKDYPSLNKSIQMAVLIGMTTTGATKYKNNIVLKLMPKVMFVEEAAHVLESHVVASLTEHCEQMILIGDHQQLKPMTADYEMSSKYRLNVSFMERLVRNGIQQKQQNWTQLKNQHRMRPEIARMICPIIYKELHNDPCVTKYPKVNKMDKNIYFLDHTQPESRLKGSASSFNTFEADQIVSLVRFFVLKAHYKPEQITVIATYLAQKTIIEKRLNNLMMACSKDRVIVSTVDGYQGEENDIVILSIVRSNKHNAIGFLKTDNRVCVALSRAKHGFFMFGNMNCLKASSDTWHDINETLMEMNCIGKTLPIKKINNVGAPPLPLPKIIPVFPSCQLHKTSHSNGCQVLIKIVFSCGHGDGYRPCFKLVQGRNSNNLTATCSKCDKKQKPNQFYASKEFYASNATRSRRKK